MAGCTRAATKETPASSSPSAPTATVMEETGGIEGAVLNEELTRD